MSTSSPNTSPFNLSLGLEGTHVLVTGGAGLIGSVVVQAFLTSGAKVSSLDLSYPVSSPTSPSNGNPLELHADISSAASLDTAWKTAVKSFGTVRTCIALASLDLSVIPQTTSLIDADPETWARVLNVNVGGTMLTAQFWLRGIRDWVTATTTATTDSPSSSSEPTTTDTTEPSNTSLIIIGSEAGHFGVRTCPAYAASKSAVQYGLLQSLRADAPRVYAKARVNAVAPGPVDTARFHEETGGEGSEEWWKECEATTALAGPVPIEAVARTVLFLASERWSGSTHGQVLNVDSGKVGALMWTREERRQHHHQ